MPCMYTQESISPLDDSNTHPLDRLQSFGQCRRKSTVISEVFIFGVPSFAPNIMVFVLEVPRGDARPDRDELRPGPPGRRRRGARARGLRVAAARIRGQLNNNLYYT